MYFTKVANYLPTSYTLHCIQNILTTYTKSQLPIGVGGWVELYVCINKINAKLILFKTRLTASENSFQSEIVAAYKYI